MAFVALTFVATLAGAAQGRGDGSGASQAAQPDFSKVEIEIDKIAGNLYTLRGKGPDFYPSPNGRPFGTIGVLVGPDGVLMVDTAFAPLHEEIFAAIRQISDGRIRFLVNTHVHQDHAGNNENIAKTGATLMSHTGLRARLRWTPNPLPPSALPVLTFTQPITIHLNAEDVRVIPVATAHTDGDTIVHFAMADAIMTGDIYRTDDNYPNIDRANGGSLDGFIDGLTTIINLAGPNTKIIAGHGPVTNKPAVVAHRDMIVAIRQRVADLVQQGKTLEDVLAAEPTAAYDTRGAVRLRNAARMVTQMFQELSARSR